MKNNTMIFIFLTILTLYQKIIENKNKLTVKNFYNKKAVLYLMFPVILTCIFYKIESWKSFLSKYRRNSNF